MKKTVLIILVDKRKEEAVTVQRILTDYGCIIKTRLGIHDGVLDECSNNGLIILELVGKKDKQQELSQKLDLLEGVKTQFVELALENS